MEEAKVIDEKWKKINSMINAASELVSPSNYDGYVQQLQARIKELEEANKRLDTIRKEEFRILTHANTELESKLKELEGSDNQDKNQLIKSILVECDKGKIISDFEIWLINEFSKFRIVRIK